MIDQGDMTKAQWVCQDLGIPEDSTLDEIREAFRANLDPVVIGQGVVAIMLRDEGKVVVHVAHPARLARPPGDGQAFLVAPLCLHIVAIETGQLSDDIQRQGDPRLMVQLAKQAQSLRGD